MKRRIIKSVVVVIILLILLLGFHIEPAQYSYDSKDLVGLTLKTSTVGYDDYIVLNDDVKKIVAVPGDILTYNDGICRNGELIIEGIKTPSRELKDYCIYDGEQIDFVNADNFTLFFAVNESAKAMLCCAFVFVVIICFIFS